MPNCHTRRFVIGAATSFLALAASAGAGMAGPLPSPTEKPILTVSGKISAFNKDDTAQFDRAMLESLGTVSFETTTPWHKGTVKFEGVPLSRLMKAVEANGQKISAVALNDYSSDIPIEDVSKYNVILALKRDGEYMQVRDKGPLFIVYPYDSAPELKSQTFYGRSVWQIAKLVVK